MPRGAPGGLGRLPISPGGIRFPGAPINKKRARPQKTGRVASEGFPSNCKLTFGELARQSRTIELMEKKIRKSRKILFSRFLLCSENVRGPKFGLGSWHISFIVVLILDSFLPSLWR